MVSNFDSTYSTPVRTPSVSQEHHSDVAFKAADGLYLVWRIQLFGIPNV